METDAQHTRLTFDFEPTFNSKLVIGSCAPQYSSSARIKIGWAAAKSSFEGIITDVTQRILLGIRKPLLLLYETAFPSSGSMACDELLVLSYGAKLKVTSDVGLTQKA